MIVSGISALEPARSIPWRRRRAGHPSYSTRIARVGIDRRRAPGRCRERQRAPRARATARHRRAPTGPTAARRRAGSRARARPARPPARPSARPMPTSRMPSPTTRRSTSSGRAPSTRRTPSSLVRCATRYAITPKSPIPASASARAPKTATSTSTKRRERSESLTTSSSGSGAAHRERGVERRDGRAHPRDERERRPARAQHQRHEVVPVLGVRQVHGRAGLRVERREVHVAHDAHDLHLGVAPPAQLEALPESRAARPELARERFADHRDLRRPGAIVRARSRGRPGAGCAASRTAPA